MVDSALLEALRRTLEDEGPVPLEHRHYRAGREPHHRLFDSYDALAAYLKAETRPGDSIWFWSVPVVCTEEGALAHGKVPDEHGRVPDGGAY